MMRVALPRAARALKGRARMISCVDDGGAWPARIPPSCLTLAETKIAASLAAGLTLKQAAETSAIRINTARWYLDEIFRKTRTNRQGQLVHSSFNFARCGQNDHSGVNFMCYTTATFFAGPPCGV